jgi:hypothetical protein
MIVEHQSMQNLSNHPAFTEQRKIRAFGFFVFQESLKYLAHVYKQTIRVLGTKAIINSHTCF